MIRPYLALEARLLAFERHIKNESTTGLPCHSVRPHKRYSPDSNFRERRWVANRSPADPNWSPFWRWRGSRSAARARARTGVATRSAASSFAPGTAEHLQCRRVLGQRGQPIQQHWRWRPVYQSGGKTVPDQREIHLLQLIIKRPSRPAWLASPRIAQRTPCGRGEVAAADARPSKAAPGRGAGVGGVPAMSLRD